MTTETFLRVARRELLRRAALGFAALPLLEAACESASSGLDATSSGQADAAVSGNADATTHADAASAQVDAEIAQVDAAEQVDAQPADAAAIPAGWASGGTAAMTAKASYPDPFGAALATCLMVSSTTAGPCTTATDLVREDISEGSAGLPVRLAIKVVDTACAPIVGVAVKIWQTGIAGSYSGETPNNAFCLKDLGFRTVNFGRGVQTTDANGAVFFDACFPGWYPGRAIHIHFQVTGSRVSQLFFPENVTQEIFAGHADYSGFGQPDTVFSNDGVMAAVPSTQRDRLVLTVARMTDGAMLASKVVTVR